MPEVSQLPCSTADRHQTRGVMVLLAVLVLAMALRAVAVAGRWDQLSRDPDAYRLIAENLREHAVFSRSEAGQGVRPTAYRPPLYPLLLAALAWQGQVTPALVAGLHIAIGALSVWLLWRVARHWQLGAWSYLAALGVAVDPILLNQAAEVMTETTATLLAIAALAALTRMSQQETPGSALLAGLMLGLAALCRPTFLVWAALVCLWLTLTSRLQRQTIGKVALVVAGVLIAVLPWIVRNQLALGKPIVATTHGGYTLLLGNNPPFYRHLRQHTWGSVWDARELLPLLQQLPAQDDELARDRQLYALAQQTIRTQKTTFAWSCLVRVGRLWTPLPHQLSPDETAGRRSVRWAVAAWYLAIYLAALAGLVWQRRNWRRAPWVWGLLLALALTAVHAFYWSNMRMRAPAMPVVYLACAVGCRGFCESIGLRKLFYRK